MEALLLKKFSFLLRFRIRRRDCSAPSSLSGTPTPPFTSVISAFDSSNLSSDTTLTNALNDANNLTNWGGTVTATIPPTPATDLVINAYGIVRFVDSSGNDFLYMIGYDVARVTKIDPAKKTVLGSITYTAASPNQAKGQAIKAHNGKLYALFIVADATFANYQSSKVFEIDTVAFAFSNTCDVGKNAVKLESGGNDMYVACIGGPQQAGASNGANSVLNKITVGSGGALTSIVAYVSASNSQYDIRDIAISSSNVLILLGVNNSGWAGYSYVLGRTTLATLSAASNTAISNVFAFAGTILSNASGVGAFYSLVYENAYAHFWCELGDRIAIYDDASIPAAGIPTPQQLTSTALYGSACVINSLCVFIDSTSAYNVPVAGALRGVVSSHDPSSPRGDARAKLRAFLEEANKSASKK
jgi:hypothetical protein